MANIIRCRHCRTFVYDTASRCHGCGEAVRGGRLLGRGAYVFVALVTVAYGIGRGVDLIQTKSQRARAYAEAARDDHQARTFLEMFLRGQDDGYRKWISPGASEMATTLRRLRDELPEVLPVSDSIVFLQDRVVDVTVCKYADPAKTWERITVEPPVFGGRDAVDEPFPSYAFEAPVRAADGPEADGNAESPATAGFTRLRPFCVAAKNLVERHSYNGMRRVTVGGQSRQVHVHRWYEKAREYEVLASNDGRRFRIQAAVHIDDGVVRTFRIGRIEDADSGEVILPAKS